jgi:hypothetical protein
MQTEKRQYYASDLSYLLDIGEIADMHVITTAAGAQVLRIECIPKDEEEYKTIKAKPGKAPKKPAPKKPRQTPAPRERRTENPATLGDKLMNGAKTWFNNKEKPNFMRDAGF